ncbi:MAG: hypothetical protein EOM44_12940 [Bacteroidia bacterium]|nr:hypothetical protein [Bacteroidia bacterium]
MNAAILNQLKEKRQAVVNAYNAMVSDVEKYGKKYNTSESFFFTVVANHFEEMSTVMVNKIIRGGSVVFYRELYKAIEKAEYAAAKAERENNRQYFTNLK